MPRKIGLKTAESYQARVATKILRALKTRSSGAIMAPTGSGKSLMIHTTVEDCLALGYPVLILHPNTHLLRQNLAQLMENHAIRKGEISVFVAQNEQFPTIKNLLKNSFKAEVIMATNTSMVMRRNQPAFIKGLIEFAKSGGVILIDEGQGAAANELSNLLALAAGNGAIGYIYSATPFRPDGRDPLFPFNTTMEDSLVEIAEYDEVLATGRIVETHFDLAYDEFEANLSPSDIELIEAIFDETLKTTNSVDAASQEGFARLFRPDLMRDNPQIINRINNAIAKIWLKRAPDHKLALFHCDSIVFAESLAAYLAATTLPSGHPHAGQHPIIGYTSSTTTKVYRGGVEISLRDDLDWKIITARDSMLKAARAGFFHAIVNVNALGVGVDIPLIDLTICAAFERSISPIKQMSGRGERQSPETGKKFQKFVDCGRSIARIYNDVEAVTHGMPGNARLYAQRLPRKIIRQFHQWFSRDSLLPIQARMQTQVIESRAADYFSPYAPLLNIDSTIDPAKFICVFPGVEICATTTNAAVLYDMHACKLITSEIGSDHAFALILIEKDANLEVIFFTTSESAKIAAASRGLVLDEKAVSGPHIRSKPAQELLPWLNAPPLIGANVQKQIDALMLLSQNRPSVVVEAFGAALVEAISGVTIAKPPAKVILDRPAAMTPGRLNFTHAYLSLFPAGNVPPVACDSVHQIDPKAKTAFVKIAGRFLAATKSDLLNDNNLIVRNIKPGSDRTGLSRLEESKLRRKKAFDSMIAEIQGLSKKTETITITIPFSEMYEFYNAVHFSSGAAKSHISSIAMQLSPAYRPNQTGAKETLRRVTATALSEKENLPLELDVSVINELFNDMPGSHQTSIIKKLNRAIPQLKAQSKPTPVSISTSKPISSISISASRERVAARRI